MSWKDSKKHKNLAATGNDRVDAPVWEMGRKVKVRLKDAGNISWVDGAVQRCAQGGAFVLIHGRGEGYFYNKDIQGIAKPKQREGWEERKEPVRVAVAQIAPDPVPPPVIEERAGATLADILARSNQQPVATVSRIGLPAPVKAPEQEAERPLEPELAAEEEQMSFEQFLDHLTELVVPPADREMRKRWFALARELHRMTLI